eukprot:GHVS01058595.1.p1 GENE.GHVS01058595.1~~GHVS01058595.1.p1  ORF type:complete len:242 (+),score=18.82 GHVS01058595.1:556-1281(+)
MLRMIVGTSYRLLVQGIEPPFEGFKTYHPLTSWHLPVPWPDASLSPDFRPVVTSYLKKVVCLARQLVIAFAHVLSIDPHEFLQQFDSPAANLRLLHYPPSSCTHDNGDTICTSGAHTDYGCCTFLLQDDVGGLQVLTREHQWVDVDPIQGAFVVNIGDMLSAWTGGRLKSTVHRVISNGSSLHRYSIPFFWNPSPDVIIKPLMEGTNITTSSCLGSSVDQYLTTRYDNAFERTGDIEEEST